MRYHFIAIGGAVMHNLAIALHEKGHIITGSDDELFDPARQRLMDKGLLPGSPGWFPEKVTTDVDAVIVGMHARSDNPELIRARELGLAVYSFPAFLYEHARNKKRVVIGGSHGKTTITAIIMHVLRHCGRDFDYLVGSQVEGFDVMVRITDDAPVMIFEGDEYLAAPFDPRPKFHLYHPLIALISGIAWDHINVFPDFEGYVEQFDRFARLVEPGGTLIFNDEDQRVAEIAARQTHCKKIGYATPEYTCDGSHYFMVAHEKKWPVGIIGRHNMQNLEGARLVCGELGIGDEDFYEAVESFGGAKRRLELIAENNTIRIFRDFAHSPSKLKATIAAVRETYPNSRLVAVMELHTFSSLNAHFLAEYAGTMNLADVAVVYFNPHAVEMKKLPPVSEPNILQAFAKPDLVVFSESALLQNFLIHQKAPDTVFLFMSSGNFNNIDFQALAKELIGVV